MPRSARPAYSLSMAVTGQPLPSPHNSTATRKRVRVAVLLTIRAGALGQNAASSSSISELSRDSARARSVATPGRTFAAKNFAAAILPW